MRFASRSASGYPVSIRNDSPADVTISVAAPPSVSIQVISKLREFCAELAVVSIATASTPSVIGRFIDSSRARAASDCRLVQIESAAPSERRQSCDCACRTGQFENVQARIGAVHDVDVAAVVGLDVVGLDRDLAAVRISHLDAAL